MVSQPVIDARLNLSKENRSADVLDDAAAAGLAKQRKVLNLIRALGGEVLERQSVPNAVVSRLDAADLTTILDLPSVIVDPGGAARKS